MNRNLFLTFSAVIAALALPAVAAKQDCFGGYKIFINRVSPFVDRVEAPELTMWMRRGLSAFDACEAGDNFTPHGIWDQIAADMEAKAKK